MLVGLVLRLFLAWFLPFLLDDGRFIPGVAYTDIDYLVFTDAANYIKMGKNPYDRHTYRYTPFLAELLAHMPKETGRFLFCIADAICGWIIINFRRTNRLHWQRERDDTTWIKLIDALWVDVQSVGNKHMHTGVVREFAGVATSSINNEACHWKH